ncbi:bifunctional 2-polyprenyl-6-hydroxyphenol methylase/3-demethylubiquinol 3-O-methyltransferase UbiG [Motiliproteus sp. SC1-56]|uniref:class I SAM-dependent methyltransferase n=1 Tax=Motiliproteus sp. SC1-56 TaxID=2799565 RepID=UPI001A8D7DE5|nr:class I SAM-dependent methyltransferase [Motiliproteus sp. SC1-56]
MDTNTISIYNKDSDKLIKQYESRTFEQVHEHARPHLPSAPGTVLEIGAGSGRDAAWFASQGYTVVAVEPASDLRRKAQDLHPSPSITWIEDSLPELQQTVAAGRTFDLVWISAVWMHLPTPQRKESLRNIGPLIKVGGRLMISLRHGPPPEGRKVYEVSAEELLRDGEELGLWSLCVQKAEDTYSRDDVWWQTVVLEKPSV